MFFLKKISILCFAVSCLLGCGPSPTPPPQTPITLTDAQEQFLKICKKELKVDAKIIPAGRSMWIYVPINDTIIDFRAAPKNNAPKSPSDKKWSIDFLEVKYADKIFTVSYDISMATKYDRDITYQNKYSDEYSTKQREILTALTRSYFDVGSRSVNPQLTIGKNQSAPDNDKLIEKMKDNPLKAQSETTPPEFFVMVFADTKRGVGIKAINYFQDMKMALSNPPAITNDEYTKRYVYELFGDEQLIGDTTGERLKTSQITLSEFLAKQIENRVKYAFTQSGFPPTGEARDEIWRIVTETCRLYEFKDFEKIQMIDLRTQEKSIYDKSQM